MRGEKLSDADMLRAEAMQLIEHLQKNDTIERASKDLLRAADYHCSIIRPACP